MADHKIGKIFVELDLDPSRYTKGQQQLYKDATQTTLNIEANFKKLGIKSAAEMDLMRAKITNSYDMIKNSAKATADDIVRAEKAKNDQLKRLNEQQFGHHTTLLENLKNNWIKVAAIIGTAMLAANQAWSMAKMGADYEEQKGILDNLAQKYKTTSDDIVSAMQKASDGLIAKADLTQVALGGIAKGLKPEQLINLADAARILGDAVGKDATTALKDLTEALETGRTKGLKGFLGTAIDLEKAFGDLYSKLTEAEKAQALYSIVMIESTKLQAQQTKEVDDAADKIERMEASYNNAKLAASSFFKTIIAGAYDAAVALASVPAYDITGMGGGSEAPTGKPKATLPGGPNEQAKAQKEIVDKYEKQIAAMKELLKHRDTDKNTAVKASNEIEKIRESAFLKEMGQFEEIEKANAKYLEDMAKNRQEEIDRYIKSEGEKLEEVDKINEKYFEDEKKRAVDRLNSERDIYKDLRGYSGEYFEATKKLIDEQAKQYRELGISEVAIAAWVKEETISAYIEMGKKSDDWVEGMSAAFLQMERDAMTMGKAVYDSISTLSTSAQSTMSSVLFDAWKGELKSFSDYWTSFTDTLLKKFMDIVAQMIVEWAMLKMAMSFGATASTITGVTGITEVVAKGNAFYQGNVIPFAQGGIVTRPTIFPMAHGAGLMGEEGQEAVMPLKRTRSGSLGVSLAGSSGVSNVFNMPLTVNGASKKWAAELRSDIEDVVVKKLKRVS